MTQLYLALALVCLSFSQVRCYDDIFVDESGQQYYLVPISSRQRREAPIIPLPKPAPPKGPETKIDLLGPNPKLQLTHKGNIFENERHLVKGEAFVNRPFDKKFAPVSGAKVDYKFKPTNTAFSLAAEHARHQGTNLNFAGKYNIVNKKDFGLDLSQQYNYQFGRGGGRPTGWGTFLNAHARY